MRTRLKEILDCAYSISWLMQIVVNGMAPALFSYRRRKEEFNRKPLSPPDELALLVHEYLVAMFKEADRIERGEA